MLPRHFSSLTNHSDQEASHGCPPGFAVPGVSATWSPDGDGGGIYLTDGSEAFWTADTNFSNFGRSAGAIQVWYGSSVSWSATTRFTNNTVDGSSGGALYVREESRAFWTGDTFFEGNEGLSGGAIYVTDYSTVWWNAVTHFTGNRAAVFGENDGNGGALDVDFDCSAWWSADTFFRRNYAGDGGAVSARSNGTVTWSAATEFENNEASGSGGALMVRFTSSASWTGRTTFVNNTADDGGSVHVWDESSVSWDMDSFFLNNTARDDGGAFFIEVNSTVSWTGETHFEDNMAAGSGGALYVLDTSSVSWDSQTVFSSNTALTSGGAVFVDFNTEVGWSGPTVFENNRAVTDGGAIGSSLPDSDQVSSLISVNGTTSFTGNTCGGNGGGVALMGVSSLTLAPTGGDVEFVENSADLAGGALFMSATSSGPEFFGARFTSNSAQVGGAVYATGSGTAVTEDGLFGDIVLHRTTFVGCEFVGNQAHATGGAVESSAGVDLFVNTSFTRNTAGVGGALRLAGTTTLDNCSFYGNIAQEAGGPAVSNIGFVAEFINSSFGDNVFDCASGTYLDSAEVSAPPIH